MPDAGAGRGGGGAAGAAPGGDACISRGRIIDGDSGCPAGGEVGGAAAGAAGGAAGAVGMKFPGIEAGDGSDAD